DQGLYRRDFLNISLGAGVSAVGVAAAGVSAVGVTAGPAAAQATAGPRPAVKPALYRGYAEGPFGLIHYRDVGEGRPLILFHQSPMSSQQFTAVYPLFKA